MVPNIDAQPLLTWQASHSVGYAPMDEEHTRLIELINLLQDALTHDKGQEVLGYVLNELLAYTQSHFASEERLMVAYRYPLTASHFARHVAATRRFVQLRAQFTTGRSPSILSVIQELEDWLAHHVQVSDRALGSFLAVMTGEHSLEF